MPRPLALLGAPFVLLLLVASAPLAGCSTAELKGPPDAAPDACTDKAVEFCDPLDAGAIGCVADPSSPSATVRKLPAGTAYPIGCQANLVGPDEQGECKNVTTCICVAAEAGAPIDAGDGGDASPPGPGAPQWQCDK